MIEASYNKAVAELADRLHSIAKPCLDADEGHGCPSCLRQADNLLSTLLDIIQSGADHAD